MTTDLSEPAIHEAYDEVHKEGGATNWMLITYKEGSEKVWTLVGKGSGGLNEMKTHLNENFRGFGYLRCTARDELGNRTKFVFITFCGEKVKFVQRSKLSGHRGDVLGVIKLVSNSCDVNSVEELTPEFIAERLNIRGDVQFSTNM